MSAHTPGPWELYGDAFGRHVRGVAALYGKNREADARLIAAAPEMLEVLQQVIKYHNDDGDWPSQIERVIAKATGGEK